MHETLLVYIDCMFLLPVTSLVTFLCSRCTCMKSFIVKSLQFMWRYALGEWVCVVFNYYYIKSYFLLYQFELSIDSPNPGVSTTVSFILTPLGSSKGSMSAVTVSMVVVGWMPWDAAREGKRRRDLIIYLLCSVLMHFYQKMWQLSCQIVTVWVLICQDQIHLKWNNKTRDRYITIKLQTTMVTALLTNHH